MHEGHFNQPSETAETTLLSSRRHFDWKKTLGTLAVAVVLLQGGAGDVSGSDNYMQFVNQSLALVEVGGPFAGVEFHHSRPVPTRISFYSPVANSIDLSTDYWKRWESIPLRLFVTVNGTTDTLDSHPMPVRWAPHTAMFEGDVGGFPVRVTWRFGERLPVTGLELSVGDSGSSADADIEVSFALWPLLRTCQTWAWVESQPPVYSESGDAAFAVSPRVDTDSSVVFVACLGAQPSAWGGDVNVGSAVLPADAPGGAGVPFTFHWKTKGCVQITQVIGSCRMSEADSVIEQTKEHWQADVEAFESRVAASSESGEWKGLGDNALRETLLWSWDMMAANRHFLNGRLMPMPCPAQYNFFFTHDALQTGLGVTIFNPDLVAEDLQTLLSQVQPDSILPHAYYWRDGEYQTEFCDAGNWNHLWFLLTTGAWLRHGGDVAMAQKLMPVLEKSTSMILMNLGEDGLMHAGSPDWWDIGYLPGRRSYLTALAAQALGEYAEIARRCGREDAVPEHLFDIRDRLVRGLNDELWRDDAGFLMNMIGDEWDMHYYAGSLVAGMYGMLDSTHAVSQLATAERELLDPNIGVRIVMPADFHTLIDKYGFNGMEMGEPYTYINGGIWPQGNAWYILSLLRANRSEEALDALRRYLTLAGIADSPGGQPSLYEYRFSNPASAEYGRVDKPTFLWAGGWFINCLYQLAGVHEETGGVMLEPDVPESLANVSFSLAVNGSQCRIVRHGTGESFSRIVVDGLESPSAVLIGTPGSMEVEAGPLRKPYLASSTARVADATLKGKRKPVLHVDLAGLPGQPWEAVVISPTEPLTVKVNGKKIVCEHRPLAGGGFTCRIRGRMVASEARLTLQFSSR
ncbi:MAG: hypothetical protein V2A56_00025 [bacterium]